MSEKNDNAALGYAVCSWIGVLVLAVLLAGVWSGVLDDRANTETRIALLMSEVAALQKPAPTPAACCKADDCRKELAQVDARFGDVWDELTQLQDDLAKVKPCSCEPSKPCACSAKPACECKPAVNSQLPTKRVLKRCK